MKDTSARRPGKANRRPTVPHRPGRPKTAGPGKGRVRLFGRHAVEAALANPARILHRLYAAKALDATLAGLVQTRGVALEARDKPGLDRLTGPGTVHQGLVLDAEALAEITLDDLLARLDGPCLLLALDQVTDPQNVGAVLRSAEVFGARAVILPARHAPAETGALAKAASGAVERVAIVRVGNLGRALEDVKREAVRAVGLAGEAETPLAEALGPEAERLCLVLGAEGPGLRPSIKQRCHALARIPMSDSAVGSLNVSNAAAVALYAARAVLGSCASARPRA